MDINTLYEALKSNPWSALTLLTPFFVNQFVMLTASKFEKQLFKPKQKIYTRFLNLVLHSITATIIACVIFIVMRVNFADLYFISFVFLVYFSIFIFFLPYLDKKYKPDYYIEDDKHGKLYIQNITSEGKLQLYSEPNPNKQNGFFIIKENSNVLLNTKIYSVKKNQSDVIKKAIKWVTRLFKKSNL